MRLAVLRFALIAAVASVAVAGCAKKKVPTGVDSNTSASDVGGFGPGSGAGSAPGGFGVGDAGAGAGVSGGQLYRDANGNLVDANGNRVDEFGNPIGGAGQYQQGGNFAQNGNQGAGQYNFAGDDGSAGYFAQRVGDRVLFDTDSSTIDSESQEILRRQAAWFQRHPQIAITIEGHADERGTRDYNLALGARRANAARSYLMSLGVDAGRIRTVSYGKERPVRPSSTPGAWRVNRRAVSTLRGGPSS